MRSLISSVSIPRRTRWFVKVVMSALELQKSDEFVYDKLCGFQTREKEVERKRQERKITNRVASIGKRLEVLRKGG